MNPAQELSGILEMVHNTTSTANEQIEETEHNKWLDKYVLKYF